MKKMICLVCSICILALAGCGSTSSPDSSDKSEAITNFLSEKGIELIARVDTLAECEDFTTLYTVQPEISESVKAIAENDYSKPQGIFIIEDLDSIALANMMPNSELPEDVAKILKGRFATAISSQISAMNGTMSIAVTSILNYEDSFICEGLKEPTSYLYAYGNGYCFMVNFVPNDEGIVSGYVTLLINDELSRSVSKEDVTVFFADSLGLEDLSVTDITVH